MTEQDDSALTKVLSSIKLGIKEARYAPGQRLVESQLSEELGVSRSTLREGLHILSSEGFVDWKKFKGASIIKMSRQQVANFMDLREVLEGHAARRATERLHTAAGSKLKKLEAKYRGATASSVYDEYNNLFHDLIIEMSENTEVQMVLTRIRVPIFRLQFNRVLLEPIQIAISREDHNKIVAAILSKDAETAETAMRNHIKHSAQCIMDAPPHYF